MSGGLAGPGPNERPHPLGRRNELGIRIDPAVEADRPVRRAVLSALVEHEPGVLAKVSGLFARRQFNIESLTVGPTENEDHARITLVVEETDPGVQQVKKQLQKQLPVLAVDELEADAIRRELALIKVAGDRPDEVAAVADMYDAAAVDSSEGTITVEITGGRQKVEAAIETFGRFDVIELARTGAVALERGDELTSSR